jgi:hypothetical protein
LALNAKGGEINRPKQKDCTTTLFFGNFLIQIGTIAFAKNLLTAKGENLSKLENAFGKYIIIPLANCKRNFKSLLQKICKNKLSGANVVQNFNYIKTFIYT